MDLRGHDSTGGDWGTTRGPEGRRSSAWGQRRGRRGRIRYPGQTSHNYCPERMFDKCESGEKVPRDSQGLALGWPGQEHPGQRRRTDGRTGNRKGEDYRPAGEKQEELV